MAATAAPGRSWLLIEYPHGWPILGFPELPLDPPVRDRVTAAAAAAGARIVLIRRPLRHYAPEQRPRRWAVLHYQDAGHYRQLWGEWSSAADLLAIPEALSAPGEAGLPPVLMVCTHGRHDVCCAVRGRPVAFALSDRWPELTWECSHIGGDRFAGNLVVVPDGVYYGGLDPDVGIDVVRHHLANRIHAEHLRGYTNLDIPQQAAVIAALARFGPAGRHDWTVLHTDDGAGEATVWLAGSDGLPERIEVRLRAERSTPHRLTCRATRESSVLNYRVIELVGS